MTWQKPTSIRLRKGYEEKLDKIGVLEHQKSEALHRCIEMAETLVEIQRLKQQIESGRSNVLELLKKIPDKKT